MSNDLRTQGIVLRRTNYGESDRILNLLTPEGKIAVLAKGVRKEKSKLAGGIELFCVSDVVIHQKPTNHSGASGQNTWPSRSGLAILTSAKMLQFYAHIITDMARLELAAECLKKVDRAAEQADSPRFFALLNQTLAALNRGVELELVAGWFYLNLAAAAGEEINLLCDTNGDPLMAEQLYVWDGAELALRPIGPAGAAAPSAHAAKFAGAATPANAAKFAGAVTPANAAKFTGAAAFAPIDARAIKLARLMLTQNLSTVRSVEGHAALLPALEPLWKCYMV